MISEQEAKETIKLWLANCICENHYHDTEDAREKKKQGKNRLFLRPAINREMKSDVRWLRELAGKSEDSLEFITRLKDYIIYRKGEYSRTSRISPFGEEFNRPEHPPWPSWGPIYWPVAPVMCSYCTELLGLTEVPDWNLVTYDTIECVKCGNLWDPQDDLLPGANLSLSPSGEPWCVACCLREVPAVKDALAKENRDQIETAYSKSKLGARAETVQEKRRRFRKENDEVLDEFLSLSASCEKCGEDDPKLLEVLPGPDSPKGTLATWRRDYAPNTFKKKLEAALIVCRDCKS